MAKSTYSFRCILLPTLTLALLLSALWLPQSATAQPVIGARNTALGGGGTAYLTGLEATLWNPANLVIHNRPTQWHIGLGHSGVIYEPVLSSTEAGNQYTNFTDTYFPYQPSSTTIGQQQRENILTQNYPAEKIRSKHLTRTDIILGGALWQGMDKAFSIVARARLASRIEVGRGWYSGEFIDTGNSNVRDFTLNQYKNHLYELSFGYAREFTFINGLFSNLNKLHVGIAPKLVLAGPSFRAQYNAQHIRSENNNELFISDLSYQSTGNYSRATLNYQAGVDPQQAIKNNFSRQLTLDNTGYGMGFDFGLTYIIPLWDDFSTIGTNIDESVVSKSIRISFSVNDIGMVTYRQSPLQFTVPRDTISVDRQEAPAESMFTGADGQYLHYMDSAANLPNPVLQAQGSNRNDYTKLLPTSINGGILIELSQLKLMGDLTLGLNNTAFTTTKLAFHMGIEVRPVQQFPIRFGTRLAAGMDPRLGLGTGIETKHWDFNIGTQLLLRSQTFTSEIVGGAFAGIQLHL